MSNDGPTIRPLARTDLVQLIDLCAEHAEYERAPFIADGLAERLDRALFGSPPRARAWVADGHDGRLAGYAIASEEFCTWGGACFLHMDCLYLREGHRSRGLGREFMRVVAADAVRRGAIDLQWQTPEWNADAIRFYDRLGAASEPKVRFTLTRDACMTLADSAAVSGANPSGRFRTRPTRPLGVLDVRGWSLKQYEITLDGARIADETVLAARSTLRDGLPRADCDPALGFSILHHGADAVWLLADTWRDEIVSQQMYAAPLARPTAFERVPPDGPTGCVWELAVHAHEREALMRHVLDPIEGPSVDDYLSDVLSIPAD